MTFWVCTLEQPSSGKSSGTVFILSYNTLRIWCNEKKIHPLHWTNVWLSLSKYSSSTRIRPKWVSQSSISMELSACWAWRGDHIWTVTPRATVRIAKPAWALPKLQLNLCNPETQGEILTTSKQLLLQSCTILVWCQELSDPRDTREDQSMFTGFPSLRQHLCTVPGS